MQQPQRLENTACPQLSQFVVQSLRGILRRDPANVTQQHGAGIQPFIHLHDGDTGLGIARQDRSLHWRRAAPARQQRSVDIEAAVTRYLQHRLRQNQPISRHHHHVGIQRGNFTLHPCGFQGSRLQYQQIVLQGKLLHRAGGQLHAAPGGTIRLGQHRDDLMFLKQPRQRAGGEMRRAGKDDFH